MTNDAIVRLIPSGAPWQPAAVAQANRAVLEVARAWLAKARVLHQAALDAVWHEVAAVMQIQIDETERFLQEHGPEGDDS